MQYCRTSDVRARLGTERLRDLLDRAASNDSAIEDDALLVSSVESANSMVDGYVRGATGNLPLTHVPAVLTRIAASLAIIYIKQDKGHKLTDNDLENRQLLMEELMRIAKGDGFELPVETRRKENESVSVTTSTYDSSSVNNGLIFGQRGVRDLI